MMLKKLYSPVVIALSVSATINFSLIPINAMELDNSDKENKNPNNTNSIIIEEKNRYSANRIDMLLYDKKNYSLTNFFKGKRLFDQKKYSDAFDFYKLSAMHGHSEAAFKVGDMYLYGQGVNINIKRAYEYFEHAAELGSIEAKNMLGTNNIYNQVFSDGDNFYQEKNFSEAFKCYEILAYKGCYESQFKVANMYYKGQGVDKSVKKALSELKKLAIQGHPQAMGILKDVNLYNALCLEGQKFYEVKNYKEAIECYQYASIGGHLESKFRLAMMYRDGVGVVRNEEKAFDLLKVVAEKEHQEALKLVGDMCFYGIGTKQNYTKAFKYLIYSAKQGFMPTEKLLEYYTLAANDGYIEAQEFIFSEAGSGNVLAQETMFLLWKNGDIVNLELETDFETLMLSPGHDPSVQYQMGCICFDSAEEDESMVQEKHKQASDYYILAANQGHVEAQISIGKMYATGIGVEQNFVKAFDYFMLAANTANAKGQFLIGYMYESGMGVEINLVKALEYFILAANQGHVDAQFNVGNMCSTAMGTEQDLLKALEYFILAANQGHVDAQFNVGKMYASGMGVEKDFVKALEYFILAGNQEHVDVQKQILLIEESGNVEAQYYVAYMYCSGWGGCDQDEFMARSYIKKYIASKLEFSDEMIPVFEELFKVLMGTDMDERKCSNIFSAISEIPPSEHKRAIVFLSRLKNIDAEYFNEIVSTDSKCLSFFNTLQVRILDILPPHKHSISLGNK